MELAELKGEYFTMDFRARMSNLIASLLMIARAFWDLIVACALISACML